VFSLRQGSKLTGSELTGSGTAGSCNGRGGAT
jgi:hypothetical protein